MSAPALSVFEYDGGLPSSLQWNSGVQMALPWQSALDVSYVGQHAWNQYSSINLNAIDFGTAFLPQYQDIDPDADVPRLEHPADRRDARHQGLSAAISQQNSCGWSTYHSLQLSFQRRFTNGVSFGFNDTWSLSQRHQQPTPAAAQRGRHVHDPRRPGAGRRAAAVANPVAHNFKANFVWDLPDIKATSGAMQLDRLHRQRLAAVGHLDGVDPAYHTPSASTTRTAAAARTSPARLTTAAAFAIVRAIRAPAARSDPYQQFNTAAFAGSARRQRRARVRGKLPERLLPVARST